MAERFDYRCRYVLGFDPSGAFLEGGKGTTGYNIMDCKTKEIVQYGEIFAGDFDCPEAYWYAHKVLIRDMLKVYGNSLGLAVEAYRLYAHTATSQINSSFETPQVIGVIKVMCYEYSIFFKTHMASLVKTRCTDEIMRRKITNLPEHVSDHILDSIRHSLYFAMFECFY